MATPTNTWLKCALRAALLAAPACLTACGPGAAPFVAPHVDTTASGAPSKACKRAAALRADMNALLQAGRIHRAARAVEQADALCPGTSQETITARVETLIALGEFERAKKAAGLAQRRSAKGQVKSAIASIPAAQAALGRTSPADLVQQGLAAKRANRQAEAQRRFDQAIALALRASGARLEVVVPTGVGKEIKSAGFTPDGKTLLIAHGRHVTWVDVASGLETGRIVASPGFSGFLVPETGRWGLEIGARGEARAFDFEARVPGPPLASLTPAASEEQYPSLKALSRDGSRAAIVLESDNTEVRVWETSTGRLIATFTSDERENYVALRFSPDSAFLAAGGTTGDLDAWSLDAKAPLLATSAWLPKDLRAEVPDATQMLDRRITGLDFASGGKELFAVWWYALRIYKLPSHGMVPPIAERTSPDASVQRVRVSWDGSTVLGTGTESRACMWDASTRAYLGPLELPPGSIDALVPVPGSGSIAVVAGGAVTLVDRPPAPQRTVVRALDWAQLQRVGFSPDSKRLVTLPSVARRGQPLGDAQLELSTETEDEHDKALWERFGLRVRWRGQQGLVVQEPRAAGGNAVVVASCARAVSWIAVSPDQSMLATLCKDEDEEHEVRLWKLGGAGGLLAVIKQLEKPDVAYVATPDGRVDFLGTGADAELRPRTVCRAGTTTFPFEVCEGWALSPGLLDEVVASSSDGG